MTRTEEQISKLAEGGTLSNIVEYEDILRIVKGLSLNAEEHAANCRFYQAIRTIATQAELAALPTTYTRKGKTVGVVWEKNAPLQLEEELDKSIESVISAFSKSCSCRVGQREAHNE